VPSGGALFQRYAAIGNSITAGFQSGGINDSTQLESYAVLLAERMGLAVGLDFNAPLMSAPGCPPPLVNVFTQERLAAIPCAARSAPVASIIHNVAVPGAAVIDASDNLDPDSDANALTTFFLGGQTQLEAVGQIRPTFVTVWIGFNDVLGAILDDTNPGDPALITAPVPTFASRYGAMMSELDAMPTIQGGVLLGVVQVVLAPYLSTGLAYFVAAQQIPTLTVDNNCLASAQIPGGGPNDTAVVFVPFPYGAAKLDSATQGIPVTLDCTVPDVITVDESINLIVSVLGYNAVIEQQAAARGWVYIDPNLLLGQFLADPTAIRPFPAFPPDPAAVTAPFGSVLSRDGIHPSGAAHALVADALADAINAAYGTSLSSVP
jgi:lysophospholipase L1-like esterase